MQPPVRVNMGCGSTPTNGWLNFDVGVRWAANPATRFLISVLRPRVNLSAMTGKGIRYADATKRIPLPDRSVDVLYSSHMVEHLTAAECAFFLKEARRVLAPGGILRLVLPDLQVSIDRYNADHDADAFLTGLIFRYTRPQSLWELLRYHYIVGRCHYYMYNAGSIIKRLEQAGFSDVKTLPAGQTGIPDPGALDLCERREESLYVEGRQP